MSNEAISGLRKYGTFCLESGNVVEVEGDLAGSQWAGTRGRLLRLHWRGTPSPDDWRSFWTEIEPGIRQDLSCTDGRDGTCNGFATVPRVPP